MGKIKKVFICILFGLGILGLGQHTKAEIIVVSSYEDIIPDAGVTSSP